VLSNLRRLFGYRALIQSLVARDLKARYRGSVLGLLWSFLNPLLLLAIYTFVFTQVTPAGPRAGFQPYALFIFCGLLPWTWFSSSLLESSTVLISGGNLIRKVLFPAEVLPIVTVLAAFVHFCLGLLIVAAAIAYFRVPVSAVDLLWLPVVIAAQLVFTLGLALIVSALTLHFRDLRDLLANLMTMWFFATPILYPMSAVNPRWHAMLNLNPFTHLAVAYQQLLFVQGPYHGGPRILTVAAGSLVVLAIGYAVFDRLRDTLAEAV
jgi:ABC-type polysaccharide/polyol phosphate export permease